MDLLSDSSLERSPTAPAGDAPQRGATAHGHFRVYESLARVTEAAFLQDTALHTSVFVRFATVAGSPAWLDPVRSPRTFAAKFYTGDGIFDLLTHDVPVPVEAKAVPHIGAVTAESLHDALWLLSDRALPCSYRMIEGFGLHTFRFVDASGESRFVRFHWTPLLGMRAVGSDEARKIRARDPDFHRRDLWEAIEHGNHPEYELGVQFLEEGDAGATTRVRPVGRLTLDKNPESFFADTTPAAFSVRNVVPGIDLVDDGPLELVDPLGEATRFVRSQSGAERRHLAEAFRAELAVIERAEDRQRVVALLEQVGLDLSDRDTAHGTPPERVASTDAVRSRKVAILAADGVDLDALQEMQDALREAGAAGKIVAKRIGILTGADGRERLIDHSLLTTSSVLFDAVYVPGGASSVAALCGDPDAVAFVAEAYEHGKAIAATGEGLDLLLACGGALAATKGDRPGVVAGAASKAVTDAFLEAIAAHRHWNR
jgi:putative intracellular protease/amidase